MSSSYLPPSPQPEDRSTHAHVLAREQNAAPQALLIATLQERLSIIADREWYQRDAEGHLHALMQVSERIVSCSAQLPAPVHPQLKHYLERCSYDKALAFLSGTPPSDTTHAH